MTDDARQLVAAVLADADARRRLVEALAQDLPPTPRQPFWQRARPFLAGFSSALVVLLAFLVPSIQDQWDRHLLRQAVDRYADIGARLSREGQFEAAEQAYGRAVELAGNQRVDLLEAQIRARVMRIYENPQWRGAVPADVSEADFIYLLGSEDGRADPRTRAGTLAAYGAYLAGLNRLADARQRLEEAIALDAASADAHTHLGNVYDDLGKPQEAERQYREALRIDPREANAHYNLGLLLAARGRAREAEPQFRAALTGDSSDRAIWLEIVAALEAQHRRREAIAALEAALRQFPEDPELRAGQRRLGGPAAARARPRRSG